MSEGPISYTLPSGRTITLRLPTMGDRERLLRRLLEEYKAEPNGAQRAALEVDGLLRREMLQSDSGGSSGGLDPDPKRRCEAWDLTDMTAYVVFFGELVNLTKDEEDAARDAAKSVRARLRGGA